MNARLKEIRYGIARWLLSLSAELLVYALILIVIAFLRAANDNMIPEEWGTCFGNHGPWRHYNAVRDTLCSALLMPFYGGCTACVSVLIRPTLQAKIMLSLCLTALLVLTYFFYWLID